MTTSIQRRSNVVYWLGRVYCTTHLENSYQYFHCARKHLNTIPYFTILGQITYYIYRHTKTIYRKIRDRTPGVYRVVFVTIVNTKTYCGCDKGTKKLSNEIEWQLPYVQSTTHNHG